MSGERNSSLGKSAKRNNPGLRDAPCSVPVIQPMALTRLALNAGRFVIGQASVIRHNRMSRAARLFGDCLFSRTRGL